MNLPTPTRLEQKYPRGSRSVELWTFHSETRNLVPMLYIALNKNNTECMAVKYDLRNFGQRPGEFADLPPWFLQKSPRGSLSVELWAFHSENRNLVQMLYITLNKYNTECMTLEYDLRNFVYVSKWLNMMHKTENWCLDWCETYILHRDMKIYFDGQKRTS